MPFKHFIQKIEGRLPQYTAPEPTDKPKFPYTFEFSPWHRMREFINGEYNEDEERTTTVSEAFLWRATPQGHGYWQEWTDYTFQELPDEQFDIMFSWAQQYDLELEEEVYDVEEDTEEDEIPVDVTSSVGTTGDYIYVNESSSWPAPTPEDIRIIDALDRLSEPLAVYVGDSLYNWADRRGWVIRDS